MGAQHVKVINNQSELAIDRGLIVRAVKQVLTEAKIAQARINVVVVDDPTIHDLNRRFLDHDYPTDVLSFPMSASPRNLEGEVIVSADTARTVARQYGWPPTAELLLYVIHGTLHLVGHDDHGLHERAEMRARERAHLAQLGIQQKTAVHNGTTTQRAAAGRAPRGPKPQRDRRGKGQPQP